MKKIWCITILLLTIFSITALGWSATVDKVQLRNWTPRQFPWSGHQAIPGDQWLYTNTFDNVRAATKDHRHKALLEVKPDMGVGITAVNVVDKDGIHPMQRFVRSSEDTGTMPTGSGGLYMYEPPATCASEYSYFFVVQYRYLLGKDQKIQAKYLQNGKKRWFTATVLGAGRYIWWPKDNAFAEPTVEREGSMFLRATDDGRGPSDGIIRFQRLSRAPMRVFAFQIVGGDSIKFLITRFPPGNPDIPQCEGTMAFQLKWNPANGDFSDSTTLFFSVEEQWDGRWIEVGTNLLHVQAFPYEPPF